MTKRRSFSSEYEHQAFRVLVSSVRPLFNLTQEFDVPRDRPCRRKGQFMKRGHEVVPVNLFI